MKKLLFSLAVILCLAACSRPDGTYYELVGGDDTIDWIEFVDDTTLRWVGPGPRLMESRYVEVDSIRVVETAPLSRGFIRRQPDGSLTGEQPFFEGVWCAARKPHKRK